MPKAAVRSDGRRRPIAGYPTQAAACAALADKGLSPEAIGREIGRDANHVRASLRRLRTAQKPRAFALPVKLLRGLEHAAEARGIGTIELAERLFEVIVRDDVVDALLGEADA